MAEKKVTVKKAVAPKATTAKKAAPKKTVAAKKVTPEINWEAVGYKAGDVYHALEAGEVLSVAEIAKAAKISEGEALLGIGWLFKEGKIKAEDNKITLA